MTERMTIQMVAQQQGILKVLDNINKNLEKTGQRLDSVEKISRRGNREAESGWKRVGRSIKGAASELVGFQNLASAITTGIRAITAEFEKIERIGKAASNRAAGVGGALRRVAANFTPDKSVRSAGELANRIVGIASDTRTPVNVVAAAAETALSARGSANVATALDAVRQSFRAFPGEGEIAQELGSRALDLAKQAGTTNTRIALGALTQAQQASRVTDLAKLGAAAPAATLATKQAGGTVEQGLELFAALTSLSADSEGRRSSTAQVALEQQLRDFNLTPQAGDKGFITTKDRQGNVLRVPKEQFSRLKRAQSGRERLAVTQQSPELAEAFLASTSFQKRSQGAINALVTGSAEARAELASATQKISPLNQQQVQNFEKFVATLDKLPFQTELKGEQQSGTNIEQFQLSTGTRRRGRAQKILSETIGQLNLAGIDVFEERVRQAEFQAQVVAGRAPEQAAINVLRSEAGVQGGESLKLINRQIGLLQQILEENRKQTANPGQRAGQPAAAANGR